MLSKESKNSGDEKRNLMLVSAAGVAILLLLLVILLGSLFRPGELDLVSWRVRLQSGTLTMTLRSALENQARLMDLPLAEGSRAFWYMARAGGVVAYLLLWLATCLGITVSSKLAKGSGHGAFMVSLHEFLPGLGVVLAGLHALVLLGDSYISFSFRQLLIPFSSPYEPFWTGLGSLAFYLFFALVISFYVRKRIGYRRWRAFHYGAYLAFLLALGHGLMAGTDSGLTGMRLLYLVTGGFSLFLLYYRMLAYVPSRPARR